MKNYQAYHIYVDASEVLYIARPNKKVFISIRKEDQQWVRNRIEKVEPIQVNTFYSVRPFEYKIHKVYTGFGSGHLILEAIIISPLYVTHKGVPIARGSKYKVEGEEKLREGIPEEDQRIHQIASQSKDLFDAVKKGMKAQKEFDRQEIEDLKKALDMWQSMYGLSTEQLKGYFKSVEPTRPASICVVCNKAGIFNCFDHADASRSHCPHYKP